MYTFVETETFAKLVGRYLSDESYLKLQSALMADPELGDVIRASGGVRKLRWAAAGRGKRSGFRIIYFLRNDHGQIWMLTIDPKNVADTISSKVLHQIRKEIEHG